LNRRTAPDLYLAVHPITRDSEGRLALDGDGDAVEWLLEMRRFPDGALLEDIAAAGTLDEAMLVQLADTIVDFHRDAEVAREAAGAGIPRAIVRGNAASMAMFPDILPPTNARTVCAKHLGLIERHQSLLECRARNGKVRHGHGDLHLANIAMIGGRATPFDCLEFDPDLAMIDVLYDLAFVLMDCWHRGLRSAANVLFNRYLDRSPDDETGIVLLPLFLSMRAAIRAHVLAAQSRRALTDETLADRARAYLALATELLMPRAKYLVAIGGLSGTGKSAVARALASELGSPPGARILRSDVIRKRAAGVLPETKLTPAHYERAISSRVYATLDQLAGAALAQESAVVADAVFARREERDAIEKVAQRAGISFSGLWLEADETVRVRRVVDRLADASDAGARVARAQESIDVGDIDGWHRVDADAALSAVVGEAAAILRAPK